MSKVSSILFAAVLFSFTLSMGCGGSGGGVVGQPDKTAEELQAESDAYEKEMEADSEMNAATQK